MFVIYRSHESFDGFFLRMNEQRCYETQISDNVGHLVIVMFPLRLTEYIPSKHKLVSER